MRSRHAEAVFKHWRGPGHGKGEGRHRRLGRTPLRLAALRVWVRRCPPRVFGWGSGSLAGQRGRQGGCGEEPGFRVLLTDAGDRKSEAVRAIRTITGLSLWNSKLLLDSVPVAVTQPDWLDAAQDAAGVLEAAGAHTTLLCDWCDRPFTREAGPLDPAPCSGPWPPEACRASCPPATDGVRPLLTEAMPDPRDSL
ncbi:ribosomal protein L7/L12 [Streptomyces bambusae]|nr:ribosomal protein L7/L12 [Streptomyces bambusae]